MIPACDDEPTKAVDEWIKSSARQMFQHFQIARDPVEAVSARDAARAFVFIALGLEMQLVAEWTVAHANNPAIRGVSWTYVVAIGRLIRHRQDDRRQVRVGDDGVQIGKFVYLPEENIRVRCVGWCADHHAEQDLFPAPMNRRIAHVNANAMLDSIGAISGLTREIDKAYIGGHQPQIAAASSVRRIGLL